MCKQVVATLHNANRLAAVLRAASRPVGVIILVSVPHYKNQSSELSPITCLVPLLLCVNIIGFFNVTLQTFEVYMTQFFSGVSLIRRQKKDKAKKKIVTFYHLKLTQFRCV